MIVTMSYLTSLSLIYRRKRNKKLNHYALFFFLLGDTRAFMCKTGADNVLRVIQLSYDHTINDPGEQSRLKQAGLDVDKIQVLRRVANSDCTRCIGDYHVKGGYKDNDVLRWVFQYFYF